MKNSYYFCAYTFPGERWDFLLSQRPLWSRVLRGAQWFTGAELHWCLRNLILSPSAHESCPVDNGGDNVDAAVSQTKRFSPLLGTFTNFPFRMGFQSFEFEMRISPRNQENGQERCAIDSCVYYLIKSVSITDKSLFWFYSRPISFIVLSQGVWLHPLLSK